MSSKPVDLDKDKSFTKELLETLIEIKEDVLKLEDEKKKLESEIAIGDELSLDIRRTLHWVLKIGNLKKSINFYERVFEMKVIRHEEFNDGCDAKCNGEYDRPWSKTMIGYGSEKTNFALELTYNYGIKGYRRGNDLRFIGLNITKNGMKNAKELGYNIKQCDDTKLFYDIKGPDDVKYRCRICDKLPKEPFWSISLNVQNVELTRKYYQQILNMQTVEFVKDKYLRIQSFGNQVPLEFYQLSNKDNLDHAKAQGRIAFTTSIDKGVYLWNDYLENKKIGNIITKPVTLKTDGKADVDVVILSDPDQYEICFVNADGFNDLCTTKDGDDYIDWKKREEMGADKDKKKFEK